MKIEIPGYDVLSTLGSGGMAIVYSAEHKKLRNKVAIKVLSDVLTHDPSVRERFLQEARVMASLRHPGIIQVTDFVETSNTLAIVMEYVQGRTLDEIIGREVGPIIAEKALPLFRQLLEATACAHEMGIVHRDIKPSNAIVSVDGTVKLGDFGIAKIAGGGSMTRTGTKLGTLFYMSPEQIKGLKEVDHRADIYSLGMTLYEMLAGRLPFDTSSDTSEFEITQKIVFKELELPSDYYPHIPQWLVKVVQKAISKDPSNRYQNCGEFLRALSMDNRSDTAVMNKVEKADCVPRLPAGMEFVSIPSGSFQMGSPSSESRGLWRVLLQLGRDEARHNVTVQSFELMATEVTQGMWKDVMGTDIRYLRNEANPDWPLAGEGSDYPVYYVSWNDCQEFINRLNDMDPSHAYRLPSEAEWEYACKAGTTTRFYWGDSDSESEVGRYCWYTENSNSSTHPVGTKEPNAWGLYDMSGNVWEWCEDVYTENYADCPTNGSAYTGSGSNRVARGGGWGSNAGYCRSAVRFRSPGDRGYGLGFRVARSVS